MMSWCWAKTEVRSPHKKCSSIQNSWTCKKHDHVEEAGNEADVNWTAKHSEAVDSARFQCKFFTCLKRCSEKRHGRRTRAATNFIVLFAILHYAEVRNISVGKRDLPMGLCSASLHELQTSFNFQRQYLFEPEIQNFHPATVLDFLCHREVRVYFFLSGITS